MITKADSGKARVINSEVYFLSYALWKTCVNPPSFPLLADTSTRVNYHLGVRCDSMSRYCCCTQEGSNAPLLILPKEHLCKMGQEVSLILNSISGHRQRCCAVCTLRHSGIVSRGYPIESTRKFRLQIFKKRSEFYPVTQQMIF